MCSILTAGMPDVFAAVGPFWLVSLEYYPMVSKESIYNGAVYGYNPLCLVRNMVRPVAASSCSRDKQHAYGPSSCSQIFRLGFAKGNGRDDGERNGCFCSRALASRRPRGVLAPQPRWSTRMTRQNFGSKKRLRPPRSRRHEHGQPVADTGQCSVRDASRKWGTTRTVEERPGASRQAASCCSLLLQRDHMHVTPKTRAIKPTARSTFDGSSNVT